MDQINASPTLLVFNCHEAWIYQLSALEFELDIIVGLPGRYKESWDENIRPIPPNSRFISLEEAQKNTKKYHCIIAHNLSDLLDAKNRPEAKILVLHSALEGRISLGGAKLSVGEMKELLAKYITLTNTHVVAVSPMKRKSWGLAADVVCSGVDPENYLPHTGEVPMGLRISNFINRREEILHWEFHQKAFADIPIRIVGHNPELENAFPSRNWQHLKEILQTHRFFIHTAHPLLEDGFNMATFEAMAAGLPVLGNNHPTSIITHGVDGFLSEDPEELGQYAKLLINDNDLARKMGAEAKNTIAKNFHLTTFKEKLLESIKAAREKKNRAE